MAERRRSTMLLPSMEDMREMHPQARYTYRRDGKLPSEDELEAMKIPECLQRPRDG